MRVCDICQTKPVDVWIEAPVKIGKQEYQVDFCKDCLAHADLKSLLVGIRERMKGEGKGLIICPKGLRSVRHDYSDTYDNDIVVVYTLEGFPLTKDTIKDVVDNIINERYEKHEWMEIRVMAQKSDNLSHEES